MCPFFILFIKKTIYKVHFFSLPFSVKILSQLKLFIVAKFTESNFDFHSAED